MRILNIYIAASWKHQHAVEMLTDQLRARGHHVSSFVENNRGEHQKIDEDGHEILFDKWVASEDGLRCFEFDTNGAKYSDLVIYIGPSGKDAAAEVGVAWGAGVPILGLHAKGEDFGLMRRMVEWYHDYRTLLKGVDCWAVIRGREGKNG